MTQSDKRILEVSTAACERIRKFMSGLKFRSEGSAREIIAVLSLAKNSIYYDDSGNVESIKGERFVLVAIQKSLLTDEIVDIFNGLEIEFRIPDMKRFCGNYKFDFDGSDFVYERS